MTVVTLLQVLPMVQPEAVVVWVHQAVMLEDQVPMAEQA
jgi:hypothetical protein